MAARLTLVWGLLLLLFGVAEVVSHRDAGPGALAFWGGSLLGGGALVLAGRRLLRTRGTAGFALIVLGSLAGMVATAWTILMPVLGLVAVGAASRDGLAPRRH